ncbi:thioredoxin-like protein [Flavobacteriaceae bacterium MAR_2010_72]|nr:thioredoxin-like protein [Flavobacteriaceae bacterium MAR_2010_72]TVZ57546.1 thioredoxin-like protein [Flavobacteriaceae bacterium MAR_2010_105]
MKYLFIIPLFLVTILSCQTEEPTQFSEEALQDTFITINDETITFAKILEKHKGKTILIDIWATWCRDCIEEMPRVKALQQEVPDVVFVFLSLDRSTSSWKKGINTYNLKGDHYFMQSGWDGPFADFIDLDWISRYMVVGPDGQIKLFDAIKANNIHLREQLITN